MFKIGLLLFLFPIITMGSGLPKNKLLDTVICNNKHEILYSFYLPSSYSDSISIPLIFFFEPAARATLPVKKYKSIADSLNIALACSYNSQNGPIALSIDVALACLADIKSKINIDTNNLIVSGFSGGSRAAYRFAFQYTGKYNIIGCGAGLPKNLPNAIPPPFKYALLMGNADFNYSESLMVLDEFNATETPLYFISYDGSHTWPPIDYFEKAVYYQLLKSDTSLFQILLEKEKEDADKFRQQNNLIAYYWSLDNINKMEHEYGIVISAKDSIKTLEKSRAFKKQLRQLQKINILEDSLNQEILKASVAIENTSYKIYTDHKSLIWWKKKINTFRKFEKSDNTSESNLGKRLLGQIGVQLWEGNRYMIELKLYEQALEMSEILMYLYPEYGGYDALKAEALAGLGEYSSATQIYKQAQQKGFELKKSAFLRQSTILQKLDGK